ncbi:hypothetical protein SCOCK_720005 [Actinacidiphila cocklensis]|uniref:Uncharacterized protein n=1 Tax=Actinacidiphila cocklensis TaxID=887465 RepID=A0A9W4E3U9_9ACTN|nr:hypothetical protein SCOCK_720005 [Actinacidiphila cocklensis]
MVDCQFYRGSASHVPSNRRPKHTHQRPRSPNFTALPQRAFALFNRTPAPPPPPGLVASLTPYPATSRFAMHTTDCWWLFEPPIVDRGATPMPLQPAQRGRVYRRCGCRNTANQQYGARCPKLNSSPNHGTWAYAVDLPNGTGPRQTRRRSGLPSENEAIQALHAFLEADPAGVFDDDALTVASYLNEWLRTRKKPSSPPPTPATRTTSTTTSSRPSAASNSPTCAPATSPPGPTSN